MAATTDEEEYVLGALRQKHGHVSAERAISGPGLVNIYTALAERDGQMSESLSPKEICARALEDPGSCAGATVEMFCQFLGTMAANVALSYDARGGVYLAGGIIGKLGAAFSETAFRHRFEDKGRYTTYVSHIPTFKVSHPFPALIALAAGPPVGDGAEKSLL